LGSRTDFIPAAWCEALRDLQDRVPPVKWAQIERTINESYLINKPQQVFRSLDETPLASATIAQVHRGELPDGTQVIVKTQYADQERLCEMDLKNLKRLAAFLQKHDMNFFDMKAVADEFDQQIPMEFDFVRESEAMTVIAENLAKAGIRDVVIPRVIPGLATRRSITMTFIDGVRPDNAVAMKLWGIKPETIATAIGRAIGQMMLVDGFMHADVHLGNILVLRDGRVCLIDFGQAKRLPEDLRLKLCEFYIALGTGHRLYILKTFGDLGIELDVDPAEMGEAFLDLVPSFANGMLDTAPLPPEIEISPFSEKSPLKTMPIRKFRSDLFMVLRAMGLLRALCDVLDVELAMSSVFAPYARAGLRKRNDPGLEARRHARVRSALTAGVALPFEESLYPEPLWSGSGICTII
jgi:predicted unusual protein kinase regulating ubiquinone biosynthesis (AarF/ABC1/UbiB family)